MLKGPVLNLAVFPILVLQDRSHKGVKYIAKAQLFIKFTKNVATHELEKKKSMK